MITVEAIRKQLHFKIQDLQKEEKAYKDFSQQNSFALSCAILHLEQLLDWIEAEPTEASPTPHVITLDIKAHGSFEPDYHECSCPLYNHEAFYCNSGYNDEDNISDCPLLQGKDIIIKMKKEGNYDQD